MRKGNIFHTENPVNRLDEEFFETMLTGNDCRLERIISNGHSTPVGQWYDQELDEWVLLVQGKATLEFENRLLISMNPGDYLFIAAHQKHRVASTSTDPACFWLALHGKFATEDAIY